MQLEEDACQSDALLCRWPDTSVTEAFQGLLAIYRGWCAEELASSDGRASYAGYRRLCDAIRCSLVPAASPAAGEPVSAAEQKIRALMEKLKQQHETEWLQGLASILAMLMHFVLDIRAGSLLVNRRRPAKPFPTYPTSPAAVRLLADFVVSNLLTAEFPATCRDQAAARRWAERALAFRILDPSFESGQLLLAVVQAVLRLLVRRHLRGSREARLLSRAVLEKLCHDCLWGIDRNELAVPAFELLVTLLGDQHGAPELQPQHLFTADAFDLLATADLPAFDGVINNPPWGEELAPAERNRLRRRFRAIQHRVNTYVSFAEMAVERLRPDGAFALILPSQAITASNSTGLRQLLLDRTSIERLVLLPRAAFGDATVRGLVLAGRVQTKDPAPPCQATAYPVVKRMQATGPPRLTEIAPESFLRLGSGSWSSLLTEGERAGGWGATVPLGDLAMVTIGVRLYGCGRGNPRQSLEVVRQRPFSLPGPSPDATPAIRGRNVMPFRVLDTREYIRFGSWLAWVGGHAHFRQQPRVFVRELCRRDGRLSTAVARDSCIPLHGVMTVVPRLIDPRILVGILNSATAARYVQAHAASFSKVDFQRITVQELRQLPIPASALDAPGRLPAGPTALSLPEPALKQELLSIVERLSRREPDADSTGGTLARLDAVVTALFTAGGETSHD